MWAMVVKELRQLRRDRRTLALLIVLPVILLIVFGYAASFPTGPDAARAWRRRGGWRLWHPTGTRTTGPALTPDLQDAVTILLLDRQQRTGEAP